MMGEISILFFRAAENAESAEESGPEFFEPVF
jgi:hypothetical protein